MRWEVITVLQITSMSNLIDVKFLINDMKKFVMNVSHVLFLKKQNSLIISAWKEV